MQGRNRRQSPVGLHRLAAGINDVTKFVIKEFVHG